jgi:hypothetical protein
VIEITTHLSGDMMARDLGFSSSNTNCYGALDSIPRAMDTRDALLDLDDALGQFADASTPRAPVDLPLLKVNDEVKPPKAHGGAFWRYPNKEEAEHEEERVWADDHYDSDATLAIEGDYAFATEAEQTARHHLLRAPGDAPIESGEAAPAAAVSVRACLEWQPKMKTWAGAVPSARKPKANKKKSQKARVPKKLRMALPVGVPYPSHRDLSESP